MGPHMGFTVDRTVQDSFVVRSLPPFCLELPLCPFYLPFLLSHRTRDDTAPLLAVAYLYITTLAGLDQGSDQSRTLLMQ